jgi:hypothetical protein
MLLLTVPLRRINHTTAAGIPLLPKTEHQTLNLQTR